MSHLLSFKSKLEGQKLEKVARVGKTLQFHFGKSDILGLHLMLRGELRDFMKIHGAKIERSPTGKLVKSETIGGSTAYFTSEQKLYE
ncbi:DNA-formamidopyrimidine glycosylase family protein [Pedobacter frigidisoli]|uniref:DNA-formamidopyrimidine glycosylase family protein n=1 Tax=Pedobacter frigidisoli TaxID=2530455 RepID=UPI0029305090|nr:DNA-formamidopyrimidine glycosylase family protein [Pedobacter frigidisoli]